MISEDHLKACETAYAEELAREASLRTYAQAYIGFTAAYAGFLFFITEKASPSSWLQLAVFTSAACFFGLGLVFSIRASRVTLYEFTFSPRDIAEELELDESIQFFRKQRIADYTVAFERNIEVNDAKANLLTKASTLFAIGVVLHGVYFVDVAMEKLLWPATPPTTNGKTSLPKTVKSRPAQSP